MFAQCVSFFLVGFDTTASTITCALYLLALNPDCQEKLYEEIREALKHSNGEVTYDMFKSMPYLEATVSEVLRMYPSLPLDPSHTWTGSEKERRWRNKPDHSNETSKQSLPKIFTEEKSPQRTSAYPLTDRQRREQADRANDSPDIPASHGNRAAMWPKPCDKFHTFDLTSSRQCSRQQATNNFPEVTSFYKPCMERFPRQQENNQRSSVLTELSSKLSRCHQTDLSPPDCHVFSAHKPYAGRPLYLGSFLHDDTSWTLCLPPPPLEFVNPHSLVEGPMHTFFSGFAHIFSSSYLLHRFNIFLKFILAREASEDFQLGNTGIVVKKGMEVQIPLMGMHYDPEFYPEPYKFKPERFLPENKDSIIPFTYMPFGLGPRNCIAQRFAQMEVKVALVQLLQRFQFSRCPRTTVHSL
ncbi:Cyp6a9 [Cordylochernes scorpioides]|uniref:Cyp6a9 n=1 Tax=Cordylochernes scorpioides TaxID=51811 RepID=A0ABY6LQF4_9ARAC|nr:Cyp6a9 [Cordylochernes scorpioides]